ncbi:DNA-binding protein [Capnocytophaga stomatis]|uniref:DNA-binding protein n=1 Tax=Capnocytophaga stomatis TaxID=1848904 RepID=A0A250G256_9FLAO|nr:helix-hairpin-helix domain-containing protein [Capnocytophaga stomatis]ATA90408.1 DNA-binding protein [Capnocytophaga stomatis]
MKRFSTFNRNQRVGIVILLLIIVVLQVIYFTVDFSEDKISIEKQQFTELNKELDSLRKVALKPKKDTILPFNPNFITDYKGFTLGMKSEEIDRLLAFRKENKFVNSAKEFQEVTKISDSLLLKISPYFKFPDWVNKSKSIENKSFNPEVKPKVITKKDVNLASKEDFMEIRGIGDVLSDRILKYREKLQGFSEIMQVSEVYGLEKEVFNRVAEQFEVKTLPNIQKKNLNELNMYELAKIPYIKFDEAKKIIALRSELVNIKSFEELLKISEFNQEKIRKIQMYLYID